MGVSRASAKGHRRNDGTWMCISAPNRGLWPGRPLPGGDGGHRLHHPERGVGNDRGTGRDGPGSAHLPLVSSRPGPFSRQREIVNDAVSRLRLNGGVRGGSVRRPSARHPHGRATGPGADTAASRPPLLLLSAADVLRLIKQPSSPPGGLRKPADPMKERQLGGAEGSRTNSFSPGERANAPRATLATSDPSRQTNANARRTDAKSPLVDFWKTSENPCVPDAGVIRSRY